MDDFDEIEPAAAQHLREVARLWSSYGPATRTWAALDGGMTWKRVAGGEYLCRYRQDPETGKKKFTSLGRRNTESEKVYADFIARRDGAKHTVISLRDRVLVGGRVAKAYGLARMPAKTGDLLRRLWLASVTDHLTVFGGVALLAYECESRLLAPADLLRDEHLVLVGSLADLPMKTIEKACASVVGDGYKVVNKRTGIHFQAPGAVGLELRDREALLDVAADRDQADALAAAFALPRFAGVTVARDAQPLEIGTFDPRTYAMAAHVLGRDEPIWTERARFAAAAAGRLGLEFDAEQSDAFPDLAVGDSIENPRI